ncbi:MAG TPA: glycosyltransferase family 1 protein [Clostridia bacterium]|nr:glycosyltransferase family 1 protein [Clostridia bacterium]
MRVGISTSVIQRGTTGIAQYVFALLRALLPHAQQHQFTLFVLQDDLPLFQFIAPSMQVVPVSEEFRPAVANILWHQRVMPGLARQLGLDLLHVPSYRRMLWPRPCPMVATIHDLAAFHVHKKYDWKRMLYGRVAVRYLARRQHAIIAISRNTARDIQHFFKLPPDRIAIVHNGIDHGRFFPGCRADAREQVRLRHRLAKPYALYVARLEHPAKNHLRLITAFEQFKDSSRLPWQLVLAGSDWHGADEIHRAINRSHWSRDILPLGFVPDDQLPDLYRAAEVFVYPSLYEGFGMPPLEAMACDCPVISSGQGSLAEVLGEAAWIIQPQDPSAIAESLCAIASDEKLAARLRQAGRAQARQFDWARTAAQTLKTYEHACNCTFRSAAVEIR